MGARGWDRKVKAFRKLRHPTCTSHQHCTCRCQAQTSLDASTHPEHLEVSLWSHTFGRHREHQLNVISLCGAVNGGSAWETRSQACLTSFLPGARPGATSRSGRNSHQGSEIQPGTLLGSNCKEHATSSDQILVLSLHCSRETAQPPPPGACRFCQGSQGRTRPPLQSGVPMPELSMASVLHPNPAPQMNPVLPLITVFTTGSTDAAASSSRFTATSSRQAVPSPSEDHKCTPENHFGNSQK